MKLKIILSIVLIIISLVLSTVTAFCEEGRDINAKLYFEKNKLSPGEVFKVSLKLSNIKSGDKTNSVSFEIEYDSDAFELARNKPEIDIKNGDVEFTTKNLLVNGKAKKVNVMYVNTSKDTPLRENKTLFYVKFRVKKEAVSGEKTFILKPVKMLDSNFKVYSVNKQEAVVSKVAIAKEKSKSNHPVFSDVSDNHWAKGFIDKMVEKNITSGIAKGVFSPKGVVTRAQFTSFLVRTLEVEEEEYQGDFKDVNEKDWYAKELAVALKLGLVKGYGDKTFKPNQQITREQMCSMAMSAYKYEMENNAPYEGVSAPKFADQGKISSWAVDSVKGAYSLGIIRGISPERFAPSEEALREQASAIIVKLLEVCELL